MTTDPLFAIETANVLLTWTTRSRGLDRVSLWRPQMGHLRVVSVGDVTVNRFPPAHVAQHADRLDLGPRLEEETDYEIYARSRSGDAVAIRHEDPVVSERLRTEADGACHGPVNFRSQVGRSRFEVYCASEHAFSFDVEVFPTKLDYETDYEIMVAEVQDIATGLALEYLQSTYRYGHAGAGVPSELEWVVLLRHVFKEFEAALQYIATRPRHGIVRTPRLTRAENTRRPDSLLRASVRRRAGGGPLVDAGDGLQVRTRVWSRAAVPTLDTPEHRWLSKQVQLVRRRLNRLRRTLERDESQSARRMQQVAELKAMETATVALERLEPLAAVGGDPPAGFASQQLLTAPGYREAYRACLVLRAGLRLEGDAVRLSLRELHQLYEYWCYLTVVNLLDSYLQSPLEPANLFKLTTSGIRLMLARGHESQVRFAGEKHRVTVRYNPRIQAGDVVLVAQQPDVMVTLEHDGWPTVHLLIDAKYRLDNTPEYTQRFGGPGPPEVAINALHRYRDAILTTTRSGVPTRTVVQAVAAFPGRDGPQGEHRASKHWSALDRIGIGTIPLLPDGVAYLDEWLRGALHQGGWSLADRAISHEAERQLGEYRSAANTRVLVAEIDGASFREVQETGDYACGWSGATEYLPSCLALVVRSRGRPQSLVRLAWSEIRAISVEVDRPSGELGGLFIVHLAVGPFSKWDLDASEGVDPPSVTSALAVNRAASLADLWLTKEQEWRLRDGLDQHRLLRAVEPSFKYRGHESGPWLKTAAEARARYAGVDGYEVLSRAGRSTTHPSVEDVLETLGALDDEKGSE